MCASLRLWYGIRSEIKMFSGENRELWGKREMRKSNLAQSRTGNIQLQSDAGRVGNE